MSLARPDGHHPMSVTFDISVSLDGYVAGPNPSQEDPLGQGGMQLHEWIFDLEAWRRPHGMDGGESGPLNDLVATAVEKNGAVVMGKRMFCGEDGPWGEDPATGWWGDEPPFHAPVFVLTHHPREPLELRGTTFFFVTEGIEAAIERARAAAGDKDVGIGGGAQVVQQALAAGLVDEFWLHTAPVLLG